MQAHAQSTNLAYSIYIIHKISQVRCGWVIHKQSTINMYDSAVVLYDSHAPALYGPGLTRACCGQVNSRAPTQPGMLSLPATFRDVAEIEMMRKWNEECLLDMNWGSGQSITKTLNSILMWSLHKNMEQKYKALKGKDSAEQSS